MLGLVRGMASVGLDSLAPARGSTHQPKRLGRGQGSGRGGTSGRGHKGQKARSGNGKPKVGFEGGQTPISRRFPKRGFFNQTGKTWAPVNLERIQSWIDQGRLTSSPAHPITARELLLSGCVHGVHDGVKLLGDGAEFLKTAIHIEPSRASQSAIKAVEALGGSVKCIYYNPLALRDLVKGRTDRKRAAPTRKSDIEWYSSWKNRGYMATPQTAEEVKVAKKAIFAGPGPRVRLKMSRSSPPPTSLRRPSGTFRTSVLGNHIAAPPPPPEPSEADIEPRRQERKSSRHSIRIETGSANPPSNVRSHISNIVFLLLTIHQARLNTEDKTRPTSVASSEFDPYYFSTHSPNQSRRASIAPEETPPDAVQEHQSTVKARNRLSINRTSLLIPDTPARDPASIDRRGLVGVGELATPRWTVARDARVVSHGHHEHHQDGIHPPHTPGEEVPNSPWTIEAIEASDSGDGRLLSTKFPRSGLATSSRTSLSSSVSASHRQDSGQPPLPQIESSMHKSVKPKMSMTEESGGEEILYKPPPRKPAARPSVSSISGKRLSGVYAHYRDGAGSSVDIVPSPIDVSEQPSPSTGSALLPPPSAYGQQTFPKARKRTSDEFAMDQSGTLISKTTGSAIVNPGAAEREKEREDKISRRRSLGVGVPTKSDRTPGKERRRGESIALGMSSTKSPPASATPRVTGDKHARQASASSTSSFHDITHPRRHDFSHLPPSPSTSSIQHFMRHGTAPPAPNTPPLPSHQSSPAVAHSLLRGTQEGWAALEDSSTAEALRKLDGLSGKSVRARSSVGSSSRPNTPGNNKTGRLSHAGSKEQLGSIVGQEADPPPPPEQVVAANTGAARKPTSRDGPPGTRASMGPPTPKRSSASSTTFTGTPTTGSRDSASLSAATSATSMSLSSRKLRRNSAGSDASSGPADAARLAEEEGSGADIPPVPPLPKDLSAYRTPPTAVGIVFPTSSSADDGGASTDDPDRTVVFPSMTITSPTSPPVAQRQPSKKWSFSNALNLRLPGSAGSPKELGLHIGPGTPGKEKEQWTSKGEQHQPTSQKDAYSQHSISQRTPRSQGSVSFSAGHGEIDASESPSDSSPLTGGGGSLENWTAVEHEYSPGAHDFSPSAPASAMGEYHSFSRVMESAHNYPKTPDANTQAFPRTPETARTQAYPRTPQGSHLSAVPEGSVRHGPRTPDGHASEAQSMSSSSTLDTAAQVVSSPSPKVPRRLTPSSIPFFRRSSSHSIHQGTQPITISHRHQQRDREGSVSPTFPMPQSLTHQASSHSVSSMASESGFSQSGYSGVSGPPSASKKTSVLNLGSLLKGSSSRKSMGGSGDKSDANKSGEEKERKKKDDKERSESRISALMGRKRGKTISSADAKRGSKPVNLPPMQMSNLPASTVQRVANLKSSSSPSSVTRATLSSSNRSAASPASNMSKASDASLRSTRQHLPTIAGSPSVGTGGQHSKEREGVSAMSNVTVKDTPTKIPRMSTHRTPVHASPIKPGLNPFSIPLVGSRRTSLNVTGLGTAQQSAQTPSRDTSPSGQSSNTNEFGMVSSNETPKPHFAGASQSVNHRSSVRASPQSVSRVPRQSLVNLPITTGNSSSSSSAATPSAKKSSHPVSLSSLRKFSNNSTSVSAGSTSNGGAKESHHSRLSILSPTKLKFLSPKVNLPVTRVTDTSSRSIVPGTPSSSRQSLSTPSPVPQEVDDEEVAGDEEMMAYIKRLHARKLAAGAKREELEDMLKFPEPIPPKAGLSPADLLASSQNDYLCQYERKEVMDFERAYYVGQGSKKNMATLDHSTNNYGYDDERGDYLVIKHDHLAYRYEIIDTLGKGSFGQVLQCRDHCTGLSVGIKIIRNKKRFHHQALVEIKILESLKKWDPEEKSHVLKMNEYFTFRNHLCIVTELLSINLYELIKANGFAGFTTALIRRFTTQMLASLVLMRQHRIVHCDLKPENVLLLHPAKSALKVIDFGSSCFEHEKVYTYIQSRFYRSPEVILGMNYHMAIDMWSLGCILAELYTGFPIFPGENEQEQLACIMEVLGVPDKDLVNRSSRKRLFFESNGQPRPVVNSKGRRRRPGSKTLAQVLRCDDELFIDFIAKCLIWDPERRLKPQPALRHPFITAGRRPKITSPAPAISSRHIFTPSSSTSTVTSSRSKPHATPQKSQIGAPTPLSSRIARVPASSTNASVPQTPTSASHTTNQGTTPSHRYRVPASSSYSSRTLAPTSSNGYAQ
ncbi:Protein tyrosine kinase [Rhizoctonia solani]|uniref:Protein tyrosine kinase n=1 Tax=Rhizoctonia solani TaxID=456999 RepID=A0A8H7LM59_9AGAM|nr:Protein tyrosine kinase [Rhizoctonia solani]